jgi:hypothetical protein
VRKTTALACLFSVLIPASLCLAQSGGGGEGSNPEIGEKGMLVKKQKDVFWRGTKVIWGNDFSAYALNPSADLTYNPYYAMSIWLIPRAYIRDDLYIQARAIFEIELTTSDETNHRHQWQVADLWLDAVYKPDLFTIPKTGIKASPNLRLILPTSQESQARSMAIGLSPGFNLTREFKLHKGKYFNKLDLMYGFKYTKNFYKYAYAQVSRSLGCGDIMRPECESQGTRNPSQNVTNMFDASLQITNKLSFDVFAAFINTFLYDIPPQTVDLGGGASTDLGSSQVNHTAKAWFMFTIAYDVLDWLSLSVGTSTYYGQLNADSSYRTPIFNRYTNLFFWTTIGVDKFANQVQSWAGRGKKKSSM